MGLAESGVVKSEVERNRNQFVRFPNGIGGPFRLPDAVVQGRMELEAPPSTTRAVVPSRVVLSAKIERGGIFVHSREKMAPH